MGGTDEQYNAAPMQYTPILEETYYVVKMVDLLVGGQSIGKSNYSNNSKTSTWITISISTYMYIYYLLSILYSLFSILYYLLSIIYSLFSVLYIYIYI